MSRMLDRPGTSSEVARPREQTRARYPDMDGHVERDGVLRERRLAVGRGVGRAVGAAVPARIEADHPAVAGQIRDLRPPRP